MAFFKTVAGSIVKLLFRIGGINPLSFTHNLLGFQNASLTSNGELKVIKKINELYRTPIIFDVGANTGEYSKALIEHIEQPQIFAFEPNQEAYDLLVEIKGISGYNLALSTMEGESVLFIPEGDSISEHSSLHPKSLFRKTHFDGVKIKTTTLDKFCEDKKIEQINFLKIDTEGHEKDVLSGAKKMLETIEVVQVEMNYHWIFNSTYLWDFYELLSDFAFFRITPKGLYPLGKYDNRNEVFVMHNLLAIRNRCFKDWADITTLRAW